MEHHGQGFLNDTSLSKTPKSPLKTSTGLRPNQRRGSGLMNNGAEASYTFEGNSFQPPLHEVTNIPSFAVLKMKFNESCATDDRNSSLGILQMENFSDFTDTSFLNIAAQSRAKVKTKRMSKSKLCISKGDKLVKKKNFPSDTTVLTAEDLDDYRNAEESDSSDIEYDGTNIPELNLDYDPISCKEPEALVSKTILSEHGQRETESSCRTSVNGNSSKTSGFDSQSMQSSNVSAVANESNGSTVSHKSKPRDSIFESIDPAYDSIFQTIKPGSDFSQINSSSKMSELMKGPNFLDLNSSEIDSIFQNQSSAELKFLKNMENLSLVDKNSSIPFRTEEISARSSSLRSSEGSTTKSKPRASAFTSQNISNDDSGDDVQASTQEESSMEKSVSYNFTESFSHKSSVLNSSKDVPKETTFSETKNHEVSFQNVSSKKSTQDMDIPGGLNFKDTSAFFMKDNEQNAFEVSDSDFISPGEALELFKKDEEILNEENKFQIGNESQSSALSLSSHSVHGDVSAPSWFLEHCHEQSNPSRVSIGTLISARTECLGRLSQDSKRERPFFGTDVKTPIREVPEGSFTISESMEDTFHSSRNESESFASQQETTTGFCETPKSHFEFTKGNNASALRDVFQGFEPTDENDLIRASALSEFLNEESTEDPLKLASRILGKCRPREKPNQTSVATGSKTEKPNRTAVATGSKKKTRISPDTTFGLDKLNSTLTRSSSDSNLGAVKTPQNKVNQALSISNVELNKANVQKIGLECPTCQQPKAPSQGSNSAFAYSRPPSSCSTLCGNAMPIQNGLQRQYGCMNHQNLLSSWGSIPHSENGSTHNCPSYNPYIQDVLRPPMSLQTPMPHFPVAVQGSVYSCTTLQGPSELVFPEKLSIGDSQCISLTVQNLPNLHFYHVSFLSAMLNNNPVSLETARVSFPGMVPCSNSNTTDIQITLSPKYEGKITVTLQVIASFNTGNVALSSYSNLLLQTKIKYESVRPDISISSKGLNKLDFDKVIVGSTVTKYVTISNRCDATVPLYLSLSDDSQDNLITFGLDLMRKQNHPSVTDWKLLSPKIMQYRLPCSKDRSVVSQVDIPIVFEAGNQDATVNFTLTAAVESHAVRETLSWFRISASVKNAKLVLIEPTQSRLSLNARIGATCSKNITVRNEASFSVNYDLAVVENNESFRVSPSSLNLRPMQSCSISVSFTPKSPDDVKGIVQAAAQPHGRTFQVAELYGQVKSSNQGPLRTSVVPNDVPEVRSRDSEQRSSSSRGSNILECNKKYLCWGGVDVGNSVYKTFIIKNSSNKSIKAKLVIPDKPSNFKILGESNRQVDSLTIGLHSKEQRTISVVFTPAKIELSSSFLVVKPLVENNPKVFSLPLSGYGGTGKLSVSQVTEKEGIGSCLDLVLPAEKRTVFNSIVVQNSGVRALFVKALFSPSAASEIEVHVSIDPQEFVLCEKEHKTLYISYTSDIHYGFRSKDCGVITLLYGDEVLRQQMRRSTKETTRTTQNDLVRDVNFDAQFIGEEKVQYDPKYQCIQRIFSVFSTNVKRYLIHLNVVEPNASCTNMTFDAMPTMQDMFPELTFNSTVYSRRVTNAGTVHDSPPVQDFTLHMLNRLSMPLPQTTLFEQLPQCPPTVGGSSALVGGSSDLVGGSSAPVGGSLDLIGPSKDVAQTENWIAKPEVVVMDSSNKDNRISLVNLSQQDLKFKIELAIDVISVSPVRGIIPAKGEIGLRITIIPFNYGKLSEDYKGYIKIICDGKEKEVLVNILKERKVMNVPEVSVAEADHDSMFDESNLTRMDQTIIGPPSVFIKDICDFPKEITLLTTVPGKVSENSFTVRNGEKESARWEISPILPHDDTSMLSQFLQIKPLSGTLKPLEASNIVMIFMPKKQDVFSQSYELSISFENGKNHKCNFKVSAKSSTCLTESTEKINPGAKSNNPPNRHKDSVYIDNENCDFPNTVLGHNSVVYATVKNGSSSDVTLDVIKPHPPFIVTQTSIVVRSKKFVKIPISFVPKDLPKVYQDVLLLHSDEGHHFMFYLKGTGIRKKK